MGNSALSSQIDALFADEEEESPEAPTAVAEEGLGVETGEKKPTEISPEVSTLVDKLFADDEPAPVKEKGIAPFEQPETKPFGFISVTPPTDETPIFQTFQKERPSEDTLEPAVLEAIKNIPESGLNAVKALYNVFRHPQQTLEALTSVAKGGAAKFFDNDNISKEDEESFEQVVEFYKKRFGTKEGFEEAFRKDPVGLALDISTLFTGGGGLIRTVGKVAKTANLTKTGAALQATGDAATAVGRKLDVISLPLKKVGEAVKKRVPKNLIIKSLLDTPKKKGFEGQDFLAKEFVKKGAKFSVKGFTQLANDSRGIRKQIRKLISDRTREGVKLNTAPMVRAMNRLIKNADNNAITDAGIKAIKVIRDEFISRNGMVVTPKQAQRIKVGLNKRYKQLSEEAAGAVQSASKQATDVLRVQVKKALEKIKGNEKLGALNATDGVLIELKRAIKDAMRKHQKRDFIGTKGLLAGVGGGIILGQVTVGGALAFAAAAVSAEKVVTSPAVQLAFAKALRKARRKVELLEKSERAIQPTFQVSNLLEAVDGKDDKKRN